jgi:glycosyltransferase involved in cell wall biosynthesis
MACGKPVIASRLGQIAEIIENGVNGLLSTPGDIAGYTDHLYRLIEDADLREHIGRNAYQTVLNHHSWNARGKAWSEICEQVVNSHRNKRKK